MTSTSTWPIGARVRRHEDPWLVQGHGLYTGDLRMPGLLHVAFVRSPHAHARVTGLDLTVARAMRGVVAALGPGDIPLLEKPMPQVAPQSGARTRLAAPLAGEIVRYVGEAVAVIVADDPYHAADAAAAVVVTYDARPATPDIAGIAGDVDDLGRAAGDDPVLVHADVPGNVAAHITRGMGDVEDAFARADTVVRERFIVARAVGAALEPRAVAARPGGAGLDGIAVTVWSSTQAPHTIRGAVAAALGLATEEVRVVAPDVGGGFGVKGRLYAEEIVVPALALRLDRPVSWVATRQEDMVTTYQGRGQTIEAALAARSDGTILGLRARIVQDCGAYLPAGLPVPQSTAQHLLGPYRIAAYQAEIVALYTHRPPLSPLRGGGRELGVYAIERLLDRLARELGLDPLEARRRNVLAPGDFPYDTGFPAREGAGSVVYDSGDYPACLERARALIGYDAFRRTQPEERRAGRFRGVAVTLFLESTGLGRESARVAVTANGAVRVTLGSPSQGQSHATTLAQVCAARLGAPLDQISVVAGDTALFGEGIGTFASRIAVMAGNAVALAARALRTQLLDGAAGLLEVAADDLELSEGIVRVRGVPTRVLTLVALASALEARGESERLQATRAFAPERPHAFAGGAHAAVVAVDRETGLARVERYVVVHDCGTVINPTVVEGQIHGGVAHGIGNALYEAMVYDEAGQPVTGSFLDYALPRACDVPPITVEHLESPSPFNPEGVKGAGEGGTIGALATVVGAVEDALAPFNVTLTHLPVRPLDLVGPLAPNPSPPPHG